MATHVNNPVRKSPAKAESSVSDLYKELRSAEEEEQSLLLHIRRIHDEKGLLLLRRLRARLAVLRERAQREL